MICCYVFLKQVISLEAGHSLQALVSQVRISRKRRRRRDRPANYGA